MGEVDSIALVLSSLSYGGAAYASPRLVDRSPDQRCRVWVKSRHDGQARPKHPPSAHQREARLDPAEQAVAHHAVGVEELLAAAVGQRRGLVSPHCYGFETVAEPVSVKRDSSSASLALTRSIDSAVMSTQPDPRFSPVSTLPVSMSSSCCSRLACSCLHQATKRPAADVAWAPSIWLNRASLAFSSSAAFRPRFGAGRPADQALSSVCRLFVIITVASTSPSCGINAGRRVLFSTLPSLVRSLSHALARAWYPIKKYGTAQFWPSYVGRRGIIQDYRHVHGSHC